MAAPTYTLPVTEVTTPAGVAYVATREDHESSVQAVVNTLSDGIEENAADILVLQGLVSEGVVTKAPVRVATTTSGTLASDFENGDTVDGVTLATNDRILIKNQSSAAENGIYIVAASGAPTRATDADSEAELVSGAVLVLEGTANAGSRWILATAAPITVGSTALTWQQIGIADPIIGEVTDARDGEASLSDKLAAMEADTAAAQADATEALDIATIEGTTGFQGTLVTGSNASARTVIFDAIAEFRRTYTHLRVYNNSGASRTFKLRRFEDAGGDNLTEVSGQTDVTLTVPSASPPQTVALETPFTLEVGEYPGVVSVDANAFTILTVDPGAGTAHYTSPGNVTSVVKSSLRDDLDLQIAIDFTEHAIEGYDYREQRDAVAANTADVALLKGDVYKPSLIGSAQAFTSGLNIQAGSWVTLQLSTKARRITHMVTRNNTTSTRAIVLQRQRLVGSDLVKVPGSTDIALTVPAGPGPLSDGGVRIDLGDASFVQGVGETIRIYSAVTGWTTYANAPANEGGYLYVAATETDTVPLDSPYFDSIRLMYRFEGFEVAWDEQEAVDPGDLVEPYRTINLDTTDLISIWGDSFTEGYGSLKGKSYPERIDARVDWPVATFALSGTTAASRLSALRSNTARSWAALGPRDYGASDVFLVFGRNDRLGATTEQFAEDLRQLKESLEGIGARVHIVCEHADQWSSVSNSVNTGFGDSMALYSIAKRLGVGFINVMEYARRVGRGPGNTNFWAGSHPGPRTNVVYVKAILEYIEANLGGPREAIKFFRPRPGRPSSPTGGFFRETFDREEMWMPIQMGMITLDQQRLYDNLDAFPLDHVDVESEFLAMKAGEAVDFEDEALVYLTLRTEAAHVTEAIWDMDDVGADVYVPANLSGTIADYTAVGSWVQVAGGDGTFTIPLDTLRRAMWRDKLAIRIVRTGEFSLTKECGLRYKTDGVDKLPPLLKPRRRAKGAELLSNTTFPTSGAPTGWAVTGGVEGQTTDDAVDGDTHLPYGADGVVEIGPPDKTITDEEFTYDENPTEDVEAQIRVTCRRWVPIFNHALTFPDDAPVTNTSFDLTKVKVTLTVGSIVATQSAPVDIGWEDLYFDVVLPAGTTSGSLKVDADDDVHVTEVSLKPMEA